MASVWMMSFDWTGLDRYLTRPASELARELAAQFRKDGVDFRNGDDPLPPDEAGLTAFIQGLLDADDWYAGKSPRDSRAIDEFVNFLFNRQKPFRPLKLKPLSDGVMAEVLCLACGNGRLDEDRNMARQRDFYIKSCEPPDTSSELLALGSRPFRHPSWDRKAFDELWKRVNPFLDGRDAVHIPNYSVHSPEQVVRLHQEIEEVGDACAEHAATDPNQTCSSRSHDEFRGRSRPPDRQGVGRGPRRLCRLGLLSPQQSSEEFIRPWTGLETGFRGTVRRRSGRGRETLAQRVCHDRRRGVRKLASARFSRSLLRVPVSPAVGSRLDQALSIGQSPRGAKLPYLRSGSKLPHSGWCLIFTINR